MQAKLKVIRNAVLKQALQCAIYKTFEFSSGATQKSPLKVHHNSLVQQRFKFEPFALMYDVGFLLLICLRKY